MRKIKLFRVEGVEAIFVETHLAFTQDKNDDSRSEDEYREQYLIPENHEIIRKIGGMPGNVSSVNYLKTHGLVTAGVHTEGRDGESEGEENWWKERTALLEGDATWFSKGADADIIDSRTERNRYFKEVVIDVEIAHLTAKKDSGRRNGDSIDEKREGKENLSVGEALPGENDDEGPKDGDEGRKKEDIRPFHGVLGFRG